MVRSGKTLEEHVTGFGVLLGVPIIIGINEFLSSQLTWWELSLGYYKKSFQNFGVSPPPPPPKYKFALPKSKLWKFFSLGLPPI